MIGTLLDLVLCGAAAYYLYVNGPTDQYREKKEFSIQ